MSIIPISIPPKKLAQSITSTDASFKVNNIEGWDGVDLVAGDLGSQHFVTFVNDTKTLMEIMEIDPATIASTSITILKRGLEFDGTESEVTANKLNWPANETTIYFGTNAPQLLNNFIDKSREQTITGLKTVPTPTADGHIANKAYVLSVVNGGAVSHDRIIVAGNAGETVAAGNLVYFDDTDNEWKLCDADTAASVNITLLGIAQGAGVNGGAISGGVLIKGIDSNQSGLTTGALYYAGNTAGGISSSTGTTERVVGFARSTTDLYFDPYFYYTVTAAQKAAMAGNNGTPSSSNKYVTESGLAAVVKFGGTGADGALTITSGTTTIDLAGAATLVKNYSSISITGTGALAFSNPHANGSVIVLKCSGAATLTSSATPMIDLRSLGGVAGTSVSPTNNGVAGNDAISNLGTSKAGLGGAASNQPGGVGFAQYLSGTLSVNTRVIPLFAGAGGGSGSSATTGTSGAGGRGAGGLYMEVAGALNFTTASGISAAGAAGSASAGGGNNGGGGGGAGGSVFILAGSITANTGTVVVTGGSAGSGASAGHGGSGGGNCFSGSAGNGENGGAGADGLSYVGLNTEFF